MKTLRTTPLANGSTANVTVTLKNNSSAKPRNAAVRRTEMNDNDDFYEDPTADVWETLWYMVKSILSGIGFITFAFLLGYFASR